MEPFILPAGLDSLQIIRKHLQKAAADAGFEKKDTYRLLLAVDEVATNIITHGYEEAGLDGNLELQTKTDDDHLTVTLCDTGAAFDPRLAAAPDVNQPIEERKLGGMGLYLAIRNVDGFDYVRKGNENRNTFIMNRRHSPPGSSG